jgi:hypothetical protein
MAARRLVAVLVVLLILSTVAAVLLPAPREPIGSSTTTTTSTEATPSRPGAAGRLVHVRFSADQAPQTKRIHIGDELRLRVTSSRSDQVEVRGFGVVEAVNRDAAATFDLFADRRGTFPVVLMDARRTIGRIVVAPRRRDVQPS